MLRRSEKVLMFAGSICLNPDFKDLQGVARLPFGELATSGSTSSKVQEHIIPSPDIKHPAAPNSKYPV